MKTTTDIKHTPGPWMTEPGEITPGIGWGFRHGPTEQDKADARLIAASPKLLAALQDLTSQKTGLKVCSALGCRQGLDDAQPHKWTHVNVCKWARAAIATAKDGTP